MTLDKTVSALASIRRKLLEGPKDQGCLDLCREHGEVCCDGCAESNVACVKACVKAMRECCAKCGHKDLGHYDALLAELDELEAAAKDSR